VAIPVRNEEAHIGSVLKSFSESKYPAIEHIIVADGRSTDRTREIVSEWIRRDPRIRLFDNPGITQSHGLNIALNSTQSEVFLRADAHSAYAEDYVQTCVAELIRTKALNVGGAQRFVSETLVQAGIALAVQSPFGSGGAKYRNWNYDGFAETVYLGCFRREVLSTMGGYAQDDGFKGEDAELNRRLQNCPFSLSNTTTRDAKLNLKPESPTIPVIYVSHKIKVWYWPRRTLRALVQQYFNYGRGRALLSFRHRYLHGRGAIIMALWISALLFLSADAFMSKNGMAASVALLGVSMAVLFVESGRVTLMHRQMFTTEIWRGPVGRKPSVPTLVGMTAAAIAIMVGSYPIGFLYQLARICWRRRIAW
jgi:glycosyltransferase involved in cell wall biosynthesis